MRLTHLCIPAGFFIACCLFSCTSSRNAVATKAQSNISSLRFLGEYNIPYAMQFQNTTIGGLSGIDYDASNDCYYMICDDRGAINPSRYYTASIFLTPVGIDSVRFTAVQELLQADGTVYPNSKQDPFNTPDPESIRFNPVNRQLAWSSEGERMLRGKDTILSDPAIRIIDMNGKLIDSFLLPAGFQMQAVETGPRQNEVFEGLSYAGDGKILFASIEQPLYQDGPRADIKDNNAFTRILKYDAISRRNIAQYAYELSPVAHAPEPANAFKVNGVSEILATGNDELLVIERSYSTGRLANTIRIFLADLSSATDVKDISSLKGNSNFKAVKKKLLLNMDNLGIYTDNIEGLTFGRRLPNGHRSLLFISDNNFNPLQKTQLLLFEVIE